MSIRLSDILSKFVGEAEEQSIKVLFEQALDKAKRMESRWCTWGGDNGGWEGGDSSTCLL